MKENFGRITVVDNCRGL